MAGPQKLRFTIHSVSGEDPEYPARELLFHSPQTRGWQTPRFCKYPQELVLRLESPSKVHQIQLLSHEFKIATKLEVFVGLPSSAAEEAEPMMTKRLGYLSFDNNERSNYQARELKSVHINVGVVALNLIGEPMDSAASLGQVFVPNGPSGGHHYYSSGADAADLNLDVNVDAVTAQKIRELLRAKEDAIRQENYDEAKAIKANVERLKVVGAKIAQLEARKRGAIEHEDYDLAKAIKIDIDKLRAAGESAAAGPPNMGGRGPNPDDIFSRVLNKGPGASMQDRGPGPSGPPPGGNNLDDMPVGGGRGGPPGGGFGPGGPMDDMPVGGGGRGQGPPMDDMGPPPPPIDRRQSLPRQNSIPIKVNGGGGGFGGEGGPDDTPPGNFAPSKPAGRTPHNAYEERPIKGKGSYPSPREDAGGMGGGGRGGGGGGGDAGGEKLSAKAPKGWQSDLPAPEAPTGVAANDASSWQDLGGEYIAAALVSKNWQLRDAALTYVTDQVETGKLQENCFRTLGKVVQKLLKDKVANVFMSACALLQSGAQAFGEGAGRELSSLVEQCVPLLLDKMGDGNPRVVKSAKDVLLALAGMRDSGIRNSTSLLVKPVKNQNAWKPVLGTLGLLNEIVPVIGVSSRGDGFDLAELMDYVGKAFNSPNADVRSAAVQTAVVVHSLVGPNMRKFLPKDANPKVKEQLEIALESEEANAPPPPVEPPKKKGGRNREEEATTTPKGYKPVPRPDMQRSMVSMDNIENPRAAKAGGGKQGGKQAAAPPPAPRTPPAPPTAEDDPAPFEAELKERERSLGKDHPDVAESCTNLAILYNQKGDYRRAQPLYERALRIYEKTYGPDHPEVAHTLTDLAVLHLEQGRDEVGRPLLERALKIQERHLGPDHPDVVAIRDVLNSDE